MEVGLNNFRLKICRQLCPKIAGIHAKLKFLKFNARSQSIAYRLRLLVRRSSKDTSVKVIGIIAGIKPTI